MTTARADSGWATTARDLVLVAMAVFLVTIVIGILNGADVVDFDRNAVLTHVHSGTVGWLTLAIVASTFLLFRAADRRLMLALAVGVPIYVLAFYTGNLMFRAISGVALLAIIAWLVYWVWITYLEGERTLPRLAVTLGLTSFGYGAVVGVLIQLALALEMPILPGDQVGAHASAMTFGYLVLAAMGFIEWRVLGTRDLPTLGLVQIGALFLGGLVISVALLAGAEQIGGMIYLLTQVVAVVLFGIRILPRALGRSWTAADPGRHFGIASLWAIGALILFMYLVFTFITAVDPEDPAAFPLNVLIASDHAVYIGVITNIVLGLLSLLFLRGRAPGWMGQLIFWGVNLGLAVFVIGLIVDTAEIKRIGAPVMGITLLVALGLLAWRAWGAQPETDALA
ncbi:MAG TPA: hypothetical protein VLA76_02590 [Candidatus Angelobacter sp.]|nr:hypothetical protein [Candidatus Angelobacter sp.]